MDVPAGTPWTIESQQEHHQPLNPNYKSRTGSQQTDALWWFTDIWYDVYMCVCVLNLCARIRCAYMCLLCKDRRGAVFHPRQATTTITSAAVDPMQLQRQLAKRPGPYSGGMGSMGRLYWRPMCSMWVCLEMGNRMTSVAPLHAHALSRLRTIMIYHDLSWFINGFTVVLYYLSCVPTMVPFKVYLQQPRQPRYTRIVFLYPNILDKPMRPWFKRCGL